MRALVLADDLTGAADTGLPFVNGGLSASILLAADALDNPADDDVLVASTETRNLPPEPASRIVGDWARRLTRFSSAPLLLKKIDSTLRGWIGVELRALLDALPADYVAWIVPAYPEMGRAMRGGVVTVHGTPLHRTEFARDVRGGCDAGIPALLAAQMDEPVGFVGGEALAEGPEAIAEQSRRSGRRAVLFDAATDQEIDRIVAAGQRMGSPILWAGSAGLGNALARRLASGGAAPFIPPPSSRPVVVAAGSRNAATIRQIAFLRERAPLRHLTLADDALAADAEGDSPAHCLITVGEIDGVNELAVAALLGKAAARVVARSGSERLLLTGGDTAAATLESLGAESLRILGTVEAGIPLLRISGGRADGALAATKAGGFGSPSSLYRAFAMLSGQREVPV